VKYSNIQREEIVTSNFQAKRLGNRS